MGEAVRTEVVGAGAGADAISSDKRTVSSMFPSGLQRRSLVIRRREGLGCVVRTQVVTVAITVKHERGWKLSCGVARGTTKVSRQQGPRMSTYTQN
jgi:hypothetical protein